MDIEITRKILFVKNVLGN